MDDDTGEAIALLRPHAVLINTARGAILDEHALITALETRLIAGAGTYYSPILPYPPLLYLLRLAPDCPLRLPTVLAERRTIIARSSWCSIMQMWVPALALTIILRRLHARHD